MGVRCSFVRSKPICFVMGCILLYLLYFFMISHATDYTWLYVLCLFHCILSISLFSFYQRKALFFLWKNINLSIFFLKWKQNIIELREDQRCIQISQLGWLIFSSDIQETEIDINNNKTELTKTRNRPYKLKTLVNKNKLWESWLQNVNAWLLSSVAKCLLV